MVLAEKTLVVRNEGAHAYIYAINCAVRLKWIGASAPIHSPSCLLPLDRDPLSSGHGRAGRAGVILSGARAGV